MRSATKNNINKTIRVHNKSNTPDFLVLQKQKMIQKCIEIESKLPSFLSDFFLFLKSSVATSTRLAYLEDIYFFCLYLIKETHKTDAESPSHISLDTFKTITAKDINFFLGQYCSRYIIEGEHSFKVIENHQRSLARKKSSLSVMFKNLFRDDLIPRNITDGFNPIQLPKPQPDAIKRLEIDEVVKLLDIVENGDLLTDKEKNYWKKTKYRDRAILVLFLTYGLRLNELQQLNISSFNFNRGEFKLYRKRGKESLMPINYSCEEVIKEYIYYERVADENISAEHQDALFLSLQKRRMTIRAIRNMVKKYTALILGTSSRNGYSPHKLRATAATALIQQGFSIFDVQNLMDHDNVATTQLYAAHKKDAKRELVKNFEWVDSEK
ncbi:tyrosine-type recombinase/integrase [Tindallia californiensis]|uniref:Site-specific recombinase XerD n=1 Tax=Tindallia californiensis TaxID=159292 RepID=A0A1H3NKX9_9FIRM|nr:tyrosine-type recombinase/integrase [Tindallia californiensis]SDY89607.1 Site-specific recombinase XerD [Tindallia californiensis]